MRQSTVAAGALVCLAVLGSGPAAGSAQQPDSLRSCCRDLHYLYEASIFKVDAMRMRVRVDESTAAGLEKAVRRGPRSSRLEHEVATRYQAALEATIDMEFLVGVSGDKFMAHSTKAFRELAGDGAVTAAEAETFSREFERRFGFLLAAKVRRGDRLVYHVAGDTLTTTFSRDDAVLLHDRHVGTLYRRITLATYFAPSSDFRRGLLDQVFRP